MYIDEVYKLYLKHFAKFYILAEINAKNHDFHGFYHENRLVGNFHHYIRNQRVEIRKYGKNSRYCNKDSIVRSVRFSLFKKNRPMRSNVSCHKLFH